MKRVAGGRGGIGFVSEAIYIRGLYAGGMKYFPKPTVFPVPMLGKHGIGGVGYDFHCLAAVEFSRTAAHAILVINATPIINRCLLEEGNHCRVDECVIVNFQHHLKVIV